MFCNLSMHQNVVLMEMFFNQGFAPRLIYVGLKILVIAILASMLACACRKNL